nr:hypothetical protein DA06_00180 [Georgenia sp. SUBG003]
MTLGDEGESGRRRGRDGGANRLRAVLPFGGELTDGDAELLGDGVSDIGRPLGLLIRGGDVHHDRFRRDGDGES